MIVQTYSLRHVCTNRDLSYTALKTSTTRHYKIVIMTQPHILLLGAHGKVSRKMIPLFLAKKWNVTALIRKDDQRDGILKLASEKEVTAVPEPGKLDVLVHSLADVKTSKDAQSVIDKVKGVDWIVWSAGAGSGQENEPKEVKNARTNAIDRDAAIAFAHAATHNDQIKRYLTISALSSRRYLPTWWTSEETEKITTMANIIGVYTKAKLLADECLTAWGEERQKRDKDFKYVVLRPGGLVDDYMDPKWKGQVQGKIQLGQTKYEFGKSIMRQDVAETAEELLAQGANGWFDLLAGKKDNITEAVEKAIASKESAIDGEDKAKMKESAENADRKSVV